MNPDPRLAALEQMAARGGSGLVGANPTNWQQTVRPALSRPIDARTSRVDNMWANRNKRVGDAQTTMLGGYSAALEATRQKAEEDRKRRSARSGGGGRASGGGSSTPTQPLYSSAPAQAADPWAWVDEWMSGMTYSGPPSVNPKPPAATPRNPRPGQGSQQSRRM